MRERQINTMMSSRASSLLRKASAGFEPSVADKTKTRAAIARRLAVGAAAGVAVAATAKSAAAAPSLAPAALAPAAIPAAAPLATTAVSIGFATKLVAAVALVGTVSAGAVTVHRASQNTNRISTPTTSMTTSATIAKAPVASPIPTAASESAVERNAVAPTQSIVPVAASPTPLAPTPIANSLENKPIQKIDSVSSKTKTAAPMLQTGEIELFQRAQQALQNDPTTALALLNEHAQRFPNGTMSEERDAARVFALCNAGRQEDAAVAGAAFLSAHPNSPQASHVRSSCANGASP